ncbi:unnamed protein product [Linum tenue]|uniref:J domain-containing protein n=1 Tax=Linum tenue TaxID=586396 RepID=A0AAV0NZV3_9ROSI|nr:unnamed protein product [Linum tenue]
MMTWDGFDDPQPHHRHDHHQPDAGDDHQDAYLNFDFLSLVSKPQDYYKILEVDYDASEDAIRANYIRLALKWHPDKQKDQDDATSRFQEINEAYQEVSHVEAYGFSPFWLNFNCNIRRFCVCLLAHGFEAEATDVVPRKIYVTNVGAEFESGIEDIGFQAWGCAQEYLNRYKGLILTCNGLGIKQSIW